MRENLERSSSKRRNDAISAEQVPQPQGALQQKKAPSIDKQRYDEFIIYFPTSVYVAGRYDSFDHFRKVLMSQSMQAVFDTSLYENYKCTLMPRRDSITKIHYKCRFCDATIVLARSSLAQQFQVITIENQHRHRYWDLFEQEQKLEVEFKRKKRGTGNSKERKQAPSAQGNHIQASDRRREDSEFQQQEEDFGSKLFHIQQTISNPPPFSFSEPEREEYRGLIEYLNRNKCRFREDSNGPVPNGLSSWQDARLCLLTPSMTEHYRKWGDNINIEVVSLATSPRTFKIIAFYVYHPRVVELLAGIAILAEESIASIATAIKMFLELQGQPPETIVTPYNRCMSKAVRILIEQGLFKGSHIYSTRSFIDRIQRKFHGTPTEKHQLVNLIKEAIYCRNYSKFRHWIKQIRDHPAGGEAVYQSFVSKLNRLCFTKIPASFSGLYNQTNIGFVERLGDQLNTDNSQTLQECIARIVAADESMQSGLIRGNSCYPEQAQEILKDRRVKEVRLALSLKVFNRFIENYIMSLQGFSLSADIQSQSQTVVHKDEAEKYVVQNWKCICYEFQKTGLPCPHLLICARQSPSKRYIELINRRWLDQYIPTNEQPNPIHAEIQIDD